MQKNLQLYAKKISMRSAKNLHQFCRYKIDVNFFSDVMIHFLTYDGDNYMDLTSENFLLKIIRLR